MSNLEHELARLRRRPPSSALDARVARSLQHNAPLLARPVPAWACAAAALVGLVAGALLIRLPAALPPRAEGLAVLVAQNDASAATFPFLGRRFVNPGEE